MSWLAADYFDSFKCKCGQCRHTCCGGWRIAVGEKEYFRIIGQECSQELHNRIEGAFVRPEFPTPERFMLMEADWTGRCRLLDSDGMCMLQKECGEEAITEVCRVYPRSYKSENGQYNVCCSASCEAVVELLLRKEPLRFTTEEDTRICAHGNVKPEITEKQSFDINDIFFKVIHILQDRTKPLRERIDILTAKAGISEYVRHEQNADSFADILAILREFCEEAPSFIPYVDELEARYRDGGFDERFEADTAEFEKHFPDWSSYFENLLCNNMLYSSFPAVDPRLDPHKAVRGLSLEYMLLRIMSICHTAECGRTTEALVDVIAEVYHVVEHTAFYYNAAILLKQL